MTTADEVFAKARVSKAFDVNRALEVQAAITHMRLHGGGLDGLQRDYEAAHRVQRTTEHVLSGKPLPEGLKPRKPKPRMSAPTSIAKPRVTKPVQMELPFGKARAYDESKHVRGRAGRFSFGRKKTEEQAVIDPTAVKKKEIFDRYQKLMDEIDHATPLTKKTTKASQQSIMADRARAKGKLSIQMYNELKKLGETHKDLYGSDHLGDAGYIKEHVDKAWKINPEVDLLTRRRFPKRRNPETGALRIFPTKAVEKEHDFVPVDTRDKMSRVLHPDLDNRFGGRGNGRYNLD